MAGAACVAPGISALQRRAAERGGYPAVPAKCVVTGGSGFVGQRLVEMLAERGAAKVVSFDILPTPPQAWSDSRIEYVQGDVRNYEDVLAAVRGAECVWHLSAAVGPFHPRHLYEGVNVGGTKNVVRACQEAGVPKIVFSSSPSTRMDGTDIDGLSETDLPPIPQAKYLQDYAETKALGEKYCTDACSEDLFTIAVAPHQVYGPRDTLFLPNMLETAGSGQLRVFGEGKNRVSFTHVDNYCHGLVISERKLFKGSLALGQFYIVTDAGTHTHPEGYCLMWEEIDKAVVGVGFASILKKLHLPWALMYIVAVICDGIQLITGTKLKLNTFTLKMLTMHRWFNFDRCSSHLDYEPIITFKEGWADTIDWFRTVWVPKHYNAARASGYGGLHQKSQQKIDMQSAPLKQ